MSSLQMERAVHVFDVHRETFFLASRQGRQGFVAAIVPWPVVLLKEHRSALLGRLIAREVPVVARRRLAVLVALLVGTARLAQIVRLQSHFPLAAREIDLRD